MTLASGESQSMSYILSNLAKKGGKKIKYLDTRVYWVLVRVASTGISCLLLYWHTTKDYPTLIFIPLTPYISWLGSLMGWYCVVWSNSNTNSPSQLLKCSAIDVEGFYGKTKMCRWQVLMFWALTDFSLSGVQSSRHNQEEVMTTEELYELHLNYTYPLKAEPHTHTHTHWTYTRSRESLCTVDRLGHCLLG